MSKEVQSVTVWHFDWGMEPIPPEISALAAAAPKRSYMVDWVPDVEPFERFEPDCPELDAWIAERNAAFARGEV